MKLKFMFPICYFGLLISCSSQEAEIKEEDSQTDLSIDDSSKYAGDVNPFLNEDYSVVFEDYYLDEKEILDRDEMEKALIDIGAAAYTEYPLNFKDAEKTDNGYVTECDYDYNGSINFLIGTGEQPNYYYGFPEPGMEHNGMDLSMYHVYSILVLPEEKVFEVKFSYIQGSDGDYSLYSNPLEALQIWQEEEYGTIIKWGSDYFIEDYYHEKLTVKNCADYVP